MENSAESREHTSPNLQMEDPTRVVSFGVSSNQRLAEISVARHDILKRNYKEGEFIPIPSLHTRADILSENDLRLAQELLAEEEEIKFKQRRMTARLLEQAVVSHGLKWEKQITGRPGSYAANHCFTYCARTGDLILRVDYRDGTPTRPETPEKGYLAQVSFVVRKPEKRTLRNILRTKKETEEEISLGQAIHLYLDAGTGTAISEHTFADDNEAKKFLEIFEEFFKNLMHENSANEK